MKFFLTIFLFLSITVKIYNQKSYSAVYTNEIRIGSDSTTVPMVINSLSPKTRLFTNSNRKLAKIIQEKRESDIFIERTEIAGEKIPSFGFSLTIDTTNLNNKDLQGEIGLGINDQKSSELIDALVSNEIITKKYIELEKADESSKTLELDISPDDVKEFKYCKLSDKKKLNIDEKNLYYNAWICDLSHILIANDKKDLLWNNTAKINEYVVFDTTSNYVYIPDDYLNYVQKKLNLESKKCKLVQDSDSGVKYFNCPSELKLENVNDLYFILNGNAFKLKAENLFEKKNGNMESLIKFINVNDNIWVLGIPFLKNYKMLLDYENFQVGLNGEGVVSFKDEYKKWTENEEIEEDSTNNGAVEEIKSSDSKTLFVIGLIAGSLVILAVLFLFVRSMKRANPKYHIELNEQYDKKEFYS